MTSLLTFKVRILQGQWNRGLPRGQSVPPPEFGNRPSNFKELLILCVHPQIFKLSDGTALILEVSQRHGYRKSHLLQAQKYPATTSKHVLPTVLERSCIQQNVFKSTMYLEYCKTVSSYSAKMYLKVHVLWIFPRYYIFLYTIDIKTFFDRYWIFKQPLISSTLA